MSAFTWSTATVPTAPTSILGYGLASNGTTCVLIDSSAVSGTTRVYYCTSPTSWSTTTVANTGTVQNTRQSPAYINGNFVFALATSLGGAMKSPNGVSWSVGFQGTGASDQLTIPGTASVAWSDGTSVHFPQGSANTTFAFLNNTLTVRQLRTGAVSGTRRQAVSNGSGVWFYPTAATGTSYYYGGGYSGTINTGTWPASITPTPFGAAHNGNVFAVLVASSSTMYTSTTAATGSWTARTLPASAAWTSLVSCGTTLLALRNTTTAYQSDDDGATWSTVTLPANAGYGGSHNGEFVLWSSTVGSATVIRGYVAGGSSKALTFSVAETTGATTGTRRTRTLSPAVLQSHLHSFGGNRNLLTFTEDLRPTAQADSKRPWVPLDADEVQVIYPAASASFGGFPVSRVQTNTGDPNVAVGVATTVAALAGRPYTASFFAKPNQSQAIAILIADKSDGYAHIWFDIVNGTSGVAEVAPGTVFLNGYGISSAGDGWYRCWVSLNSNIGAGDLTASAHLWNDTLEGFYQAGDGLWLTGAQVEQGALTPYQARQDASAGLDSVQRSRAAIVPVNETETVTASIARARRAVVALAEAFSYSFNLSKLGAVKSLSMAITEVVAHAATVVRNRRTSWTVTETEALTQALRAARALQLAVAESITQNTTTRCSRPVTSSVAESAAHTIAVRRNRTAVLAIAEAQTMSAAVSRVRRTAMSVAEAFSYSFTMNGPSVKALTMAVNEVLTHSMHVVRNRRAALTVPEAESLSLLLRATRALQQTIVQSETVSTSVRRARTAAANIAELESVTVSIARLKLMAYVIAETESNAFWMNRARNVTVTVSTLETVQASFNRGRAFVTAVNETQGMVVNFGRLRQQIMSITETQGLSAAVGRVRTLVQSIANSIGYSFTITTYGGEPGVLNILVTWQEWQASADGTLSLVNRSETLSVPMKQHETLTLEGDKSTVLIVPTNSL